MRFNLLLLPSIRSSPLCTREFVCDAAGRNCDVAVDGRRRQSPTNQHNGNSFYGSASQVSANTESATCALAIEAKMIVPK